MVNHSLTNSVHRDCLPPRRCAMVRTFFDAGFASSILCHGNALCCDQSVNAAQWW
jgi:hypothetical protein